MYDIFDESKGSTLKILIDTNIIIQLEDNKVVNQNFADFYQFAISNKCEVYYHPLCLRDIRRDKDLNRQEITLSKLKKYTPFPDPAGPVEQFIELIGQKKENDEIDNHQLFQVYKDYADLLISEDAGIKTKATFLGISSKVLRITEGLRLLKEKFTLVLPSHPSLVGCSVRQIEEELSDAFFDSLRQGYQGFDAWFLKCARENRRCYLLKVDDKLSAILIYHQEKAQDHGLPGISEDALKMCTLKVDETVFGYRLGELFLQKMITLCIDKGVNYLYLTVFEQHIHLIRLLTTYGFYKEEFLNKQGQKELRMIKSLRKGDYQNRIQSIEAHPFYSDAPSINKFIIPIQEKFYRTLFKDGTLRAPTLFDGTIEGLVEIQGNTISKAYICKSKRLTMKTGDILFFYSSGKHKVVEPTGILDSVQYTRDIAEVNQMVKRKTVYTEEELASMLTGQKELTVLIFRLIYYLKTPIRHQQIKKLKSYSNNFQTITTLDENDYSLLKSKNYFDERYIIN